MMAALRDMPWPIVAFAVWTIAGFMLFALRVPGYLYAVETGERRSDRSVWYWVLAVLTAPARLLVRLGS